MKKTYFIPSMDVVVLSAGISLMTGSHTLGKDDLPNASFYDPQPGSGLIAD